jgi:GT2 family glycosyltransferase
MYYEDLDFSLRLHQKGYISKIIEEACFTHFHAETTGEHSNFFNRQVTFSLYYFQYKFSPFLRRLKTHLRYLITQWDESSKKIHPFAKPFSLCLTRFEDKIGKNYILGPHWRNK